MEDQNLDIRCGLILNIQLNKSVVNEYIDDKIHWYLDNVDKTEQWYVDWEFAKCGDNTYEDMFYIEFKSLYIIQLNNFPTSEVEIYDIIENLVTNYIQKKWINIIYGVSDN